MKRSFIQLGIAVLFVLLFLYTGISKLAGYHEYVIEIQQSPYLKSVPASLAWVLPAIEFLVAGMLVTGRWRRIGFYASCSLMTLFTLYLIALSQFSDYIPCSCGGFIDTLPRDVHIILNCVLILLTVLGIVLQKKVKMSYQNRVIKNLS